MTQRWGKAQRHCISELECVYVCSMQMCASTFVLQVQVCSLLQVQWSGRHLREAAIELQDSAQAEAQRRAAQRSVLALILPPHVLHILTLGKLAGKTVE